MAGDPIGALPALQIPATVPRGETLLRYDWSRSFGGIPDKKPTPRGEVSPYQPRGKPAGGSVVYLRGRRFKSDQWLYCFKHLARLAFLTVR